MKVKAINSSSEQKTSDFGRAELWMLVRGMTLVSGPKLSDEERAELLELVGDRLDPKRLPELEDVLIECHRVQQAMDSIRTDSKAVVSRLDRIDGAFKKIKNQLNAIDVAHGGQLDIYFRVANDGDSRLPKKHPEDGSSGFSQMVDSMHNAVKVTRYYKETSGTRTYDDTYSEALKELGWGFKGLFPEYKVTSTSGSFFPRLAKFWLRVYCNKFLENPQNHIQNILDDTGEIKKVFRS